MESKMKWGDVTVGQTITVLGSGTYWKATVEFAEVNPDGTVALGLTVHKKEGR